MTQADFYVAFQALLENQMEAGCNLEQIITDVEDALDEFLIENDYYEDEEDD